MYLFQLHLSLFFKIIINFSHLVIKMLPKVLQPSSFVASSYWLLGWVKLLHSNHEKIIEWYFIYLILQPRLSCNIFLIPIKCLNCTLPSMVFDIHIFVPWCMHKFPINPRLNDAISNAKITRIIDYIFILYECTH